MLNFIYYKNRKIFNDNYVIVKILLLKGRFIDFFLVALYRFIYIIFYYTRSMEGRKKIKLFNKCAFCVIIFLRVNISFRFEQQQKNLIRFILLQDMLTRFI